MKKWLCVFGDTTGLTFQVIEAATWSQADEKAEALAISPRTTMWVEEFTRSLAKKMINALAEGV